MKITFEISSSTTKRLLVLGISTAVVLAGTVAYAEIQTFVDGETLSAKKLNDNFAEVDARLKAESTKAPVVVKNGKSYSLGATFVKATVGSPGKFQSGADTGYASAKSQCEAIVASQTAHMCTSEELTRSLQLGVAVTADGWYAAGIRTNNTENNKPVDDCRSWTSSDAQALGSFWLVSGGGYPGQSWCYDNRPILCCD
jgi:hypothetical protein